MARVLLLSALLVVSVALVYGQFEASESQGQNCGHYVAFTQLEPGNVGGLHLRGNIMFVVANRLPSVTRMIVHRFPSSISDILSDLHTKPQDTEETSESTEPTDSSESSESSDEEISPPVPIENEEDASATGGESSIVTNVTPESLDEEIPSPVPIETDEEDASATGGDSSPVTSVSSETTRDKATEDTETENVRMLTAEDDSDAAVTADPDSDKVSEDTETENVRMLTAEDDSDAAVTADPASDERLPTETDDAAATKRSDPLASAFDAFVLSRDWTKKLDLDDLFSMIPPQAQSSKHLQLFLEFVKAAKEFQSNAQTPQEQDESAESGDSENESSENESSEDESSENESSEGESSENGIPDSVDQVDDDLTEYLSKLDSTTAVPVDDEDSAVSGDDAEVTVVDDYFPFPSILPGWTVANIVGLVVLGLAFVFLVTMMILSLASIIYGCADPEDDDSTVLLYEDNTKTPLLKSYVVEYSSPRGQHVNPVAVYVPPAAK
ncbi:unnamed protein product [Closterium sp. NIES-65]|nr:unnamed protein product [Closterium sp. NIES-65]